MMKLSNPFLRKWRFLLLLLVALLVVNLGHVRASEKSPPPEDWQLQGMLAALDDSDPDVWVETLHTMSQHDVKPPVEIPSERAKQIVVLLDYDNWSVSRLAADTVGQMGVETEELIPQLQKLLNDNNSDVRRTGLYAVGRLGSEAKVFIPQLQKLLDDNNSDIRRTALYAVGQIGFEARELIPQVQKLLSDNNSDVRVIALEALIQMGSEGKDLMPQLQKLLNDNNPDIREMTLRVMLLQMGVKPKELIPQLQKLLSDNNSDVRRMAALVVGEMRYQAKDLIPQLQKLSKSNDSEVSRAARRAMGRIIYEAKEFIPILQELSTDDNPLTRIEAADILAWMGPSAKELIPQLKKLLTDDNPSVRYAAIYAVGWSRWDYNNKELTPYLRKLLTDDDEDVRNMAAFAVNFAVSHMGSEAKVFTPQLIRLLGDDNENTRERAAEALSQIGSEAKELIPQLDKLLGNDSWIIRAGAAEAVGYMGLQAQELIPQLGKLLEDDDPTVRREAAEALGYMGSQAKDLIPQLLNLLADGDLSSGHTRMDKTLELVRPGAAAAAATAISRIRKLNTHEILQILNVAHRRYDERPTVRSLAYFVSAGEPNAVSLIQWLGLPKQYPYQTDKFNNTRKEGKKVLEIFADAWPHTENLEYLRPELERQIDFVVKNVDWQPEDIALLQQHYNNLQDEDIRAEIVALRGIQWFSYLWKFLLLHAITWLILFSLYPISPEIQTLFWHPQIRRIAGLGYVGLLLTWIPFLRRRLLSPFQPILIADANLDSFNPQDYFPDSKVCLKDTHNLQPIKTAIAKVQSPTIVEGESGLGKSMFLRYWAKTCKNLVVYLPASKCAEGAIAAIQAKIPISQTDRKFLENLIYNNALEICIDGLNEVTADTRTKISYFVERHFRGHILLATQPLDWIPPSATKTYILQPLQRQQIGSFLRSRQFTPSAETVISRSEYEDACEEYLETAFNSQKQSQEERKAVRRLLSNPMDLTIVGQILAQGKTPDLLNLQQQQYQVMAVEYEQINLHSFPLTEFAETAYQMRLQDEINIPSEWKQELFSMEKHKMVLRRQRHVETNSGSQWYFRHDKIQEYFIVQTFLTGENQKLEQHINDPRFRGVYLLLATLLPYDKAWLLREKLLQNAAETKDHVVSDRFIQRLNSRSELSKNGDNFNWLEIIKLLIVEKNSNINVEVNPNIRSDLMTDSYQSKYDQRNSQNSFVDTAQSGSKQEFNASMTQNNYNSEPKQTLAEAAEEIQKLLQQLESNNPAATDAEKEAFVTASIPPNKRQRFVGALQAGGKEALKELLDNPYINVGVAILEGWQNP